MNGQSDPQRNHIRFVVLCITLLGAIAFAGGAVLIFKGYNGDLMIGGGLAAVSGLTGMLSMTKPNPPPQDITVTTPPTKTEITSQAHATPTPEPTPTT